MEKIIETLKAAYRAIGWDADALEIDLDETGKIADIGSAVIVLNSDLSGNFITVDLMEIATRGQREVLKSKNFDADDVTAAVAFIMGYLVEQYMIETL